MEIDRDLLVVLTAAPFSSDTVTSALRIVDAALGLGATVGVWACGYSTALTLRSLGPLKPADLGDLRAEHPSTAALVGDLLAGHPERFSWQVCRFCAEERGATEHIDGVPMRAFSRFRRQVGAARTSVYVGGS